METALKQKVEVAVYTMQRSWYNAPMTSTEKQVAAVIDDGNRRIEQIRRACPVLSLPVIQRTISNLYGRGLLTVKTETEEVVVAQERTLVEPTMEMGDVELRILHNFDLSKIDEVFEIASFERPVSQYNVRNILEAIERKQFYDNIISVTPQGPNHKFGVLDGQHRLSALKLAFQKGMVSTFTIILRIFKTADAREIYRRINSGKPLTMNDFIKSLDDGRIEFFNAFRAFCSHYPERHKVTYQMLAYGLLYAKSETNKLGYTKKETIKSLLQISQSEITFIRTFFTTLRETVGTDTRGAVYYKAPVFSNLLRAYVKRKDARALAKVLQAIKDDPVIHVHAKSGRRGDGMTMIYSRILEKW